MSTRKQPTGRRPAPSDAVETVKPASLRHGAITRTLPTYSTYKRWSDQVKSGWKAIEEPNP